MERITFITEYFEEIETEKEYDGYYYKISDVITIVILGSICGLKNLQQIHQWAIKDRTREFLKEEFGIYRIPCYYWITCILKIIKPESFNRCFEKWVRSIMPEKADKLTISLDGKTVRSTGKMQKYESPLHIISAQISELGLTLSQCSTEDKSNEIPTVQKLLKELNIKGTMITADALNCQKETAEIIVKQKADYLFSVKDNHPNLKKDIEDFIQDETMHWLLDVQFEEDWCRVEDKNIQKNLNIFRKYAINLIKLYKSGSESKKPISNIMLDCLLDFDSLLQIVIKN